MVSRDKIRIIAGLNILIKWHKKSIQEGQYDIDHPHEGDTERDYQLIREGIEYEQKEIEEIKKLIDKIEKGDKIN